jgi:hypothetical protein
MRRPHRPIPEALRAAHRDRRLEVLDPGERPRPVELAAIAVLDAPLEDRARVAWLSDDRGTKANGERQALAFVGGAHALEQRARFTGDEARRVVRRLEALE